MLHEALNKKVELRLKQGRDDRMQLSSAHEVDSASLWGRGSEIQRRHNPMPSHFMSRMQT